MPARQLAPEVMPLGITVNAVNPGVTDTGWVTDEIRADLLARMPAGRIGAGEDAARLSATLVLADLRMQPAPTWPERTRAFLDSLAIGAEIGSAPGALLVNFFSRSDPERGSWPYLFWTDDKGPRMQGIEGRDLRFTDLATRPGPGGRPAVVAALFVRRGPNGGQPISFAWKPGAGGAWTVLQTLGPDSLGGAGSGEFTTQDSTLVLHTRTYRTTKGFTECATCPHVYATHLFEWRPAGFVRRSDEEAPSPYSTFVRFILAQQKNDRDAATDLITDGSVWDKARELDWQSTRGSWRVAPSTDETAHEMTFFRGEKEAYRVSFEGGGGRWRISAIEPTSASVE
ncbi:MAG TPA: hypothetical protein VFF36_13765 [Planctomycetota bacterium]|nr:hypothetical protein [Planctomycetota bacterium]